MQALMAEIKSAVTLLANDSEPDELHMRACMGLTTQLMKDLRNNFVESGQYGEEVTSHTSKVLTECRTQLGFLFRSVPCHAGGGKVTSEVHRCFLQVMDSVIVQFEKIIKESSNKPNSGDPDPQKEIGGDLTEINHNLKLFRKLTLKRRRKSESDLSTELLEFELKLHNIKEEIRKLNESEVDDSSRDGGDETDVYSSKRSHLMKNSHHSRRQTPDCRSMERQRKSLPQSKKNKSQNNLTNESSTSFDNIFEDLSELESNVAMVGSYQNIEGQNPQVLWVQKERPSIQTSPDFTFKDLPNLEKVENQTNVTSENPEDLRVSCAQKDNSMVHKNLTSTDPHFKNQPKNNKSETNLIIENRNLEQPMNHTASIFSDLFFKDESCTRLSTESPQDLRDIWDQKDMVQTNFTSSDVQFKDLPLYDGSETNLRIDSGEIEQPMIPAISSPSDFILKYLLQPETEESLTRLTTQNTQDLRVLWEQKEKPIMQTSSTSSDFILKDQPQLEKVESPRNVTTENPQDWQVFWDLENNCLVQTNFTYSDTQFNDLPQNDGSDINLSMESGEVEQPMIQSVFSSSDFILNNLPQPEEEENPQDLRVLWEQKEEPIMQTSSTSSDFISKDLPELEIVESPRNVTTENPQNFQVFWDLENNCMVRTNFTYSDDQFKDLPQNDGSETNLRIESGEIEQPMIPAVSSPSDFILNNLAQPEKEESLTRLATESLQDLQVLWARTDSPMVHTNSSPCDFSMTQPTIQTESTSSNCINKDLTNLESCVALTDSFHNIESQKRLKVKSKQDLKAFHFQKDNSKHQANSTLSDFIFKDLPQSEKHKSQTSLTTKRSLNLDLGSNMALAGSFESIQNIQSLCQDLSEKVESETCLISESSPDLQVLWVRPDNPMVHTSFSRCDIQSRQKDNPMTHTMIPSKVASANTSQLPESRKNPNRKLEIKKVNSPRSYFSVGKTFGNKRLRLLNWCKDRTKDYGVPMYEFSESWRSGRALVAIIDSYNKGSIEKRILHHESPENTLTFGARVAKHLGVDSKVDIVQVCLQKKPDFCRVFEFVEKLELCLEPHLK